MPLETPNLNSGDVIPEGYFGMLYRDLKSLLLRGDGKYLFVDNTPNGQVIRFRPQAEQRGGGVGGGGSIGIGVVTTPPPAGGGPGAYRKITLAADGSWEAVGEEIPIVFPAI